MAKKNLNKILSALSLAASDTRDDTIKSLITYTLFELSEPIDYKTLKEFIISNFEIEPHDYEFKIIIEQLLKDNLIIHEGDKYRLREEEITNYNILEAKIKSDENSRYTNFVRLIEVKTEKRFEISEYKILWKYFREYLYLTFYHYGIKALEFFHPDKIQSNGKATSNTDILNEVSASLPEKLRPILKIIIDNFIEFATKEDIDFIDELGQKTLSFTSLGVSKEDAESNFDRELIDWVLFLDTNYLFSVLDLHFHPENDACKELLSLVISNPDVIKIKFRYSELTLKELRGKSEVFKELDATLTRSGIKAILDSGRLDEFSSSYYSRLYSNPTETIHPNQIIELSATTLAHKNIQIFRTGKLLENLGKEYIDTRIVEYQRYINIINESRNQYSKENKIAVKQLFKSDSQINHDVCLREMIISLRHNAVKPEKAKTFNNVKYFGVTLDDLLIKFDLFEINRSSKENYPSFFKPSYLLNKFVRLLPVKTENYKKAFIKAVSSRGFNKDIRKSIDIIKIVSYLKGQGIDDEDIILNLINEKLFIDKFKEESSKDNFKPDTFFESEINALFRRRSEELTQIKTRLQEVEEQHATTALELAAKEKETYELEKVLSNEQQIAKVLQKVIAKAEKQKKEPSKEVKDNKQTTINFDSIEHEKEAKELRKNLQQERIEKNRLLNQIRKPLRERFLRKKVALWRLKTFFWLMVFPLIVSGIIILTYSQHNWSWEETKAYFDSLEQNILLSVFKWFLGLIYSGIFISVFSSKFTMSNKMKFIENINIPEDLKEINTIDD